MTPESPAFVPRSSRACDLRLCSAGCSQVLPSPSVRADAPAYPVRQPGDLAAERDTPRAGDHRPARGGLAVQLVSVPVVAGVLLPAAGCGALRPGQCRASTSPRCPLFGPLPWRAGHAFSTSLLTILVKA